MKRLFDLMLAMISLVILLLPMMFLGLIIKITSRGPVLYWSDRVGRFNRIFKMPKFRTMKVDTPEVATHLLADPDQHYTKVGKFLRKFSLDEMPQILSVIKGDMSIVGPRPALFNQDDLIALRTRKGVHEIPPGITGWAQVNGRDELPIPEKVDLDEYYLRHRSFYFDLKTIWLTFHRVIRSQGVSH